MRKYRASNRVPFVGFLLLLLIAVLGGAVLGGILWAVDDLAHFYLVIVFPLFAGAIAGGIFRIGVRLGKVRSPLFALLMGILAGLIMFGVYHFADYYVTFRGTIRDAITASYNTTPTDAQLDQAINQELTNKVGDTGFVGYLKYYALQGFSITNSTFGETDTSDDMQLQGNVVYGYWVVEILIAAITAGALAYVAANQPFDEESGGWFGAPTRLAQTTTKNSKALINALKDGNWQQAGAQLTAQEIKYPRHEVLLRRAPTPGAVPQQQDIYLTVSFAQRRGRTVVKSKGLMAPSE